jgi:hypothetical protein
MGEGVDSSGAGVPISPRLEHRPDSPMHRDFAGFDFDASVACGARHELVQRSREYRVRGPGQSAEGFRDEHLAAINRANVDPAGFWP